jgi:hypothetical protein
MPDMKVPSLPREVQQEWRNIYPLSEWFGAISAFPILCAVFKPPVFESLPKIPYRLTHGAHYVKPDARELPYSDRRQ